MWLVILFAVLLAGCAADAVWYHPTKDAQAFNVDRYECQRDARMLPATPVYPIYTAPPPSYDVSRVGPSTYAITPSPGTQMGQAYGNLGNSMMNLSASLGDIGMRQRIFNDCMGARGYHLGERRAAAAPTPPAISSEPAPAVSTPAPSPRPAAPRKQTPDEAFRDAKALQCAQMPALCR